MHKSWEPSLGRGTERLGRRLYILLNYLNFRLCQCIFNMDLNKIHI